MKVCENRTEGVNSIAFGKPTYRDYRYLALSNRSYISQALLSPFRHYSNRTIYLNLRAIITTLRWLDCRPCFLRQVQGSECGSLTGCWHRPLSLRRYL